MKRRLRLIIPLFSGFIFTVLLLSLFYYSQQQRRITQQERKIAQWERQALSGQQFFNSMGRFEEQLLHRFYLLQTIFDDLPSDKKISSDDFQKILYSQFTGPHAPVSVYACENTGGKVKLFSGKGFTQLHTGVFRPILSALAKGGSLKLKDQEIYNKRVGNIFSHTIDFSVLKDSPGLIATVPYDNCARLLYWNTFSLNSEQQITMLALFPDRRLDEKLMMSVFSSFAETFKNQHFALVPVEKAAPEYKTHFSRKIPEQTKKLFKQCLSNMAALSKENNSRNAACFPGEFADYENLHYTRACIDFNYTYELWTFNTVDDIAPSAFSAIEKLTVMFFFTAWILVFARILITGMPIGINLRSWLTLIFLAVGLMPLLVCGEAGITHIESTAYRHREKAVNDVLKHLEEADASSESVLNEYRNLCIEIDSDKNMIESMLSNDGKKWESAINQSYRRFKNFGFPVASFYVFPSETAMASGSRLGIFQLPEADNASIYPKGEPPVVLRKELLEDEERVSFDTGLYEQYKTWFKIAYYKKCKAVCLGKEPTLPILAGKSADQVMRIFISKRGAFENIDFSEPKQYMHHNFFLSDGLPMNWYFVRISMDEISKKSLIYAVKKLKKLYSDDFFGVLHKNKVSSNRKESIKLLYPDEKKASAYERNEIKSFISRLQVSDTGVIDINDDRLLIIQPCIKAGSFFLYGIADLRFLKVQQMLQEILLAALVILMCLPVFWLSKFAAGYLITPLKSIESGLRKIAAGDYNQKMSLNRSDELGRLASAFDKMTDGIRERKNLGLFVSATLDKEVVKNEAADLGKMRKYVGAALCSDIRSFTALSEAWPVRDVVSMLNNHLKVMSECITRQNGMIEQFVGDAIIAAFYAETETEAMKKAMAAAEDMMFSLKTINEERERNGQFTYKIGIGIEPGIFLAGTINSGTRNEYILFGKARTKAEELEGCSKLGRSTKIVVSDKGYQLMQSLFSFSKIEGADAFELQKAVRS